MAKRRAYIPIIENSKINEDDAFFMIGVQYFNMIQHCDKHCMFFTMDMMIEYFNIKGRRAIEQLYDSFYKLLTLNVFDWKNPTSKSINKNTAIFIQMNDQEKYTWCNLDFVDRILFSDYNFNRKKNILNTYLALEDFAGNKRYAYPSIRTVAERLGFSKQTAEDSLEALIDLNIIHYQYVKGRFYNKVYAFDDSKDIAYDLELGKQEILKFVNKKEDDTCEIRSLSSDCLFDECPDF